MTSGEPDACTVSRPAVPLAVNPARPDVPARMDRIVLLGNPNVGKSVLFGHLTRSYATVSNYPGTTVELITGRAAHLPGHPEIVDTPGTNSLLPLSEDERVTRDFLLNVEGAVILQVGDAKNLRRTLLLSLELAEMEVPFVLALNMVDEARARGIEIDTQQLSQQLGVPVVTTVATRQEGIERMVAALGHARPGAVQTAWPRKLAALVDRTVGLLPDHLRGRRGLAAMLLAGDSDLAGRLLPATGTATMDEIRRLSLELGGGGAGSLAGRLARARLRQVDRILAGCIRKTRGGGLRHAWIDRLTTHPVWGVPVVLLVLWGTYQVVGVFGAGTCVDFMENVFFGRWFNPLAAKAVSVIPWAILRDLLIGPYGLITMALTYAVAIVLPIVFFFFVIFGLLEDSGYLPRLAVMLDKVMAAMGLNGKAVLPMMLGLGCDTMATLTTRILETRKEKILVTLLLALGVPCSAQLAVILGLMGSLSITAMAVWSLVVGGTMLIVGWTAARLLPGDSSDFILELPPLRVPTLGNTVRKTLARLEWYLKEAIPLFLAGTLLLFILDRFGLIKVLEKAAAPVVVHWLQLPKEAASAFVVGFLRRDYGAVFLADAARNGTLAPVQTVVALVTLTLFVPCVANYFIMIKERGLKLATWMVLFIFPFAFFVGGVVNWILRTARFGL